MPILLELLPYVILNIFCLCMIVHMRRNQLVPQLLLKQSDTLLTQYRLIEHLCEGVKKLDAKILIIPPAKWSFRGYTVFSMSVIPSFRQHLMFLLYNFDSCCPILFKFTLHRNHQTMYV